MPIDKNIPRHLNVDDDRRTLKGTESTSALNYSISSIEEEGKSVGTNAFGNEYVTAIDSNNMVQSIGNERYVTIGKAADAVNRKVYFALAHSDTRRPDLITELDVDSGTYSIIIRDARLRFDPASFAKMDVVINVGQEQDVLLYFTDNVNGPRKINIGRAKLGDYENLSDEQFNYAVSVCKAANVYPPQFFFDTDSQIRHNNFKKDVYQFATQIIYKDGEESAISPYSALAIPPHVSFANNEDDEFFINDFTNNVLIVKIDIDDELYSLEREVSEVRLLGKIGNLGTFYIIDQFNPREDKSTMIFGQEDIQVYSSQDRTYRFYNDTLGRFIPQQEVNKLFDNVPLVAEGQAFVGNRLMYSNYKEGRPNVETRASITPVYQEVGNQFVVGPDADFGNLFNATSATEFQVSFASLISQESGLALSDITQGGESVSLKFEVTQGISSLTEILPTTQTTFERTTPFGGTIQFDNSFPSQSVDFATLTPEPSEREAEFSIVASAPQTYDNLFSSFSDYMSSKKIRIPMLRNGQPSYSLGVANNGNEYFGRVEIEYDIQATYSSGSMSISVSPVRIFRMIESEEANGDILATINLTDCISDIDSFSVVIQGNSWFNAIPRLTIQNVISVSGFKNGSVHRLGVVYYDEFNRSGFVNEIGSAYVGWTNDPARRFGQGNVNTSLNSNPSPAALEVTLTHAPPSWAKTYQIVYPGASSLLDYVQYTVGGAYLKRKDEIEFGGSGTPIRKLDTDSKRIYVSLETLQEYRSEKNTFREYSFTEGDKLRIASFKEPVNAGEEDLIERYPSASDGSIIEFDVVGVELLDRNADNPIAFRKDGNGNDVSIQAANSILKEHIGRFVVLENPRVISGSQGADGNQLKFLGLDWYALANSQRYGDGNQHPYPDGTLPDDGSVHWYKNVVIEVYTPKPNLHDEFWYEIGERRDIVPVTFIPGDPGSGEGGEVVPANHGGPFLVTRGDVFYRPVPCKSPFYGNITPNDPSSAYDWFINWPDFSPGTTAINRDEWSYESRFLESNTPSDVIFDKMWHRGRPHVKFENAKTFHRFNQVAWSEPNVEDSKYLLLSSFNPSLANFYSFEAKYGAARFIEAFGDELNSLVCLQQNKLSLTPVDRRIIADAGGQSIATLNTNVLSSTNYYSGNYGCSNHPESVLVYDGNVFFVDTERRSVVRFSNGQIAPISKQKMNSVFEKLFAGFKSSSFNLKRIPTGYDPASDVFYVTFFQSPFRFPLPDSTSGNIGIINTSPDKFPYDKFISSGTTLSYSNVETDRRWISFHSFIPEMYAHIDNEMYTCRFIRNTSTQQDPFAFNQDFWLFHHKDSVDRCLYYFTQHGFQLSTAFNQNPSLSKLYDAFSIEGNGNFSGASIKVETNQGTVGGKDGFARKEGVWYLDSPRSTQNSTSNIKPAGIVQEVNGNVITVSNISGMSIPRNAPLFFLDGGLLAPVAAAGVPAVASVSEPDTIVVNTSPLLVQPGDKLFIATDAAVDGDPIRGQWCDSTITVPIAPDDLSIFAINSVYTQSLYGHALSE